MKTTGWAAAAAAGAALLLGAALECAAAPKAKLWERWTAQDPQSRLRVDHADYDAFLRAYVDDAHPSGVTRFRYARVSAGDRAALGAYLGRMEQVPVSRLPRDEQRAFWINVYNALTLRVVLDHYPVKSIRDIDISPGFAADGPWGAKLLTVEGVEVTLDDIEHRILRPIWRDPRLHYAVNCASIGCPNLPVRAFTAGNTEELLEEGASRYVNHPRGAALQGSRLTVSSIYKWFREDFGGTEEGVVEHLGRYAREPLRSALGSIRGRLRYRYDWGLNE